MKAGILAGTVQFYRLALALPVDRLNIDDIESDACDSGNESRRDGDFDRSHSQGDNDNSDSEDGQGSSAFPPDNSGCLPRSIRGQHEHCQQSVAYTHSCESHPATETKRCVNRQCRSRNIEQNGLLRKAGKREGENTAKQSCCHKAADPCCNKPRGQGDWASEPRVSCPVLRKLGKTRRSTGCQRPEAPMPGSPSAQPCPQNQ